MVTIMNKRLALFCATALLVSSGNAWAQDDTDGDEAETTIRLMGAAEAELPEAVTREIELPKSMREDSAAVDKARKGLEKANENRQRREHGLATAEAAREKGAEMADNARDNRENRGRSEDNRPDRPNGPPDNPGPPDGR